MSSLRIVCVLLVGVFLFTGMTSTANADDGADLLTSSSSVATQIDFNDGGGVSAWWIYLQWLRVTDPLAYWAITGINPFPSPPALPPPVDPLTEIDPNG